MEASMERHTLKTIPVRSFAESNHRPRVGIRTEKTTTGTLEQHRHDYYEIWFFKADGPDQLVSYKNYPAPRGTIFFIPPMTVHQIRFASSDSCYVLYFDLSFLRPDLADHFPEFDAELLARVPLLTPFDYYDSINFRLDQAGFKKVDALCQNMIAERKKPDLFSDEIIRSNINLLLAEIMRRFERQIRQSARRQGPTGCVERHVRNVIKFISDNVTAKLTLTDAARVAAVSPNYLAKLLKQETGMTFVDLLTEKRMERARELLAFTDMRMCEIGYEVGFSDHNYFYKRFKQTIGCTPAQFRERHVASDIRQRRKQGMSSGGE